MPDGPVPYIRSTVDIATIHNKTRETMTLSSSSHQQRKSMLPTPRLSSRIGSRRAVMNNTSRIAKRVPNPLLAPRASSHNTPFTQPHVPPPARNCNLPLHEFGSRRPGSPSRIPSPSGQASYPTPESSSLSPPIRTLRLEGRRVEAHYPTPPASAETKNERFKDQGDTNPVQHHGTDIGAPALPVRHLSRHPVSTALSAFSRVENCSPVDGGPTPVLARKKSTSATSSNGKENRRLKAQARIRESPLPMAAPVTTIPLRPIRRTAIAQRLRAPSHETLQRPLVIRKQSPQSLPASSAPGHPQVRSAASASVIVPKGIKALMGDLDRFAKEWTVMFNNLFASAGTTCREDGFSNSNLSSRIHSTIKPECVEASQADNPAIRKLADNYPVPRPSGSVGSVNALQASNLVSNDGEMVNFDVKAVSLPRSQHSDSATLKDAPLEARTKLDLSEMASASAQDSPHTDSTHLHPPKAILRRQPVPITPQASRYVPPLPEIYQSPLISGSHLVTMTSGVFEDRKDKLTRLIGSPPVTPHCTDPAQYNNAATSPHPIAMFPSVSSSPISDIASRGSVSIPYTSSPSVTNPRVYEFASQPTIHAASDTMPLRSSSLRGLRAIFKRTSSGLADGQRRRAESLKERIGEPRLLSLGNVRISNLQDAGVARGNAMLAGSVDGAAAIYRQPDPEDDCQIMSAEQ